MHEIIKYVNHLGEVIEFGKGDYFINYNDLRDYSWSYDSDNKIITNFTRAVSTKSIPIIICGKNNTALKNKLFEVFEKDVLTSQKGAFWIGDYYYRCYVVESKKSNYLNTKGAATVSVTVVTDEPYWVTETSIIIKPVQNPGTGAKKYPYSYPYKYAGSGSYAVSNNTLSPVPFIMRIYGPCSDPDVMIGNQKYALNMTINSGEYVTITAFEEQKTIVKTGVHGEKTNCFNYRDKTVNVFAPIPPGHFNITWDNTFTFELIICDRRSEPPWI